MKELVINFYQDKKFTRILPDKKDSVSPSRNVHKQKHLVLCNLKQLFSTFKSRFPSTQIDFSSFCSLKPKWCILAGASGTHAVCVCTIHQNTKFLINTLNTREDYKDMIFLVCTENIDCIILRCSECPSSDIMKKHIFNIIGECDDDTEITYKQ